MLCPVIVVRGRNLHVPRRPRGRRRLEPDAAGRRAFHNDEHDKDNYNNDDNSIDNSSIDNNNNNNDNDNKSYTDNLSGTRRLSRSSL